MENSNIKISIIIVNYNSFELIRNCLRSIYKYQPKIDLEVIVVDNASTEGNVEQVTSEFDGVYTIKNQSNLGFAAANNIGIKRANGKYILFLNSDTIFFENALDEILSYCEESELSCFLGCRLLNEDFSFQESVSDFDNIPNLIGENFFLYKIFPRSPLFNKYNKNYLRNSLPFEVDVIKGAFMFCKTEDIRKLNGFDENFFFYSEENDLCYRFKKIGGKIIFYPGMSIIHIGRATSMKNLWFKFKNQSVAKIQFYQKHFAGIKFSSALLIHYSGILLRVPVYFIIGLIKISKFNMLKSYHYFRSLFIYPQNKFKSL